MTGTETSQLVTAEVHWGGAADAIAWVGAAPVYQFWPLLAPHFGGTLLAPQRRMEGDVVAWTWRDVSANEPPTAVEMAELRARLTRNLRAFLDSAPDAGAEEGDGNARKNRANIELLVAVVEAFIARWLAKSDRELARFVARTESGLRMHSWGAAAAAIPLAPDQLGREISGLVIDAGKAAAGVEVVLRGADGAFETQTLSDADGHFRFSKIQRGKYRLHAEHSQISFPPEGIEVVVDREPIAALKLRSTARGLESSSDSEAEPANRSTPRSDPDSGTPTVEPLRQRRRRPIALICGLLAAGAAAWLAWRWLGGTAGDRAAASLQAGIAGRGGSGAGQGAGSAGDRAAASLKGGIAVRGGSGAPAAFSGAHPQDIPSGGGAASTFSGAGQGAGSAGDRAAASLQAGIAGRGGSGAPAAFSEAHPQDIPSGGGAASTFSGAGQGAGSAGDRATASLQGGIAVRGRSGAPAAFSEAHPQDIPSGGGAASTFSGAGQGAGSAGGRATASLQGGIAVRGRSGVPAAFGGAHPQDIPSGVPAASSGAHPQDIPSGGGAASTFPGAVAPGSAGDWGHQTLVTISAWRVRLLADPILPTLPTDPTGNTSPDALASMRAQLLAEQQSKMPATFRRVSATRGFTVEIPGAPAPQTWHWQIPAGARAQAVTAEATSNQAELAWPGENLAPAGAYRLVNDAGICCFQLAVSAAGDSAIGAADGVRPACWLAIRPAPEDAAIAARFNWQRTSGGELPSTWLRSTDPRGARIDIPLSTAAGIEISDSLAWFDPVTGWAATARIRQTPAGRR